METDPQTAVYLNLDPAFTGIEKFLKTNRLGERIVPAGSARDFFLYIHDEQLEEAQAFLTSRLEGRARGPESGRVGWIKATLDQAYPQKFLGACWQSGHPALPGAIGLVV